MAPAAQRRQPSFIANFQVLADPTMPEIDFIAVHGLNPFGRPLHAEATWTAGESLWLRDFLPLKLPRARILLFNYNANVAFQSSTAGVLEQAHVLLNQLELARADNPQRPLIFICHSLGGIVVKRALISAKQTVVYENIVASTFGIIFFGTPHRGVSNYKMGHAFANLVRKLGGEPKNSFLDALRSDSWLASSINDDFRQFLEVLEFQSYYETRPLGIFGFMIDPRSAVLGLSETREKQIPLDADHSTICKFERQTDPIYRQVEGNIVRMADDAVKHFEKTRID